MSDVKTGSLSFGFNRQAQESPQNQDTPLPASRTPSGNGPAPFAALASPTPGPSLNRLLTFVISPTSNCDCKGICGQALDEHGTAAPPQYTAVGNSNLFPRPLVPMEPASMLHLFSGYQMALGEWQRVMHARNVQQHQEAVNHMLQ